MGALLRWGNTRLRRWRAANRQRARGVGFGSKPRNRAAGARFSQTPCGGLQIQVVECIFGRCNTSIKTWGVRNRATREGVGFESKPRNQAAGARFSQKNVRGPSDPGSGVHFRVVQRQFKEVGGRNWATRERSSFWDKISIKWAVEAPFVRSICGR